MTRAELTRYIFDTYSVEPDYPFSDDNVSAVFRHPANRKWFALAMNIPARRLGLPSDARIDIVNLKCDPILIVSLRGAPGFFPAYHMRKDSWITAALDGTVPEEQLKLLLDMSYRATAPKVRRKKINNTNFAEDNDE